MWPTAPSPTGAGITISFKTAEARGGKTKLKYKDVEVGVVESVHLSKDLGSVICEARMVNGAEEWLKEGARFWVVEPRIAGGQVSGLTTLLSGAYIGVDPVREGKRTREFVGLDEPPVVTAGVSGRYFDLRSTGAGAISVGSPIFFRHIEVGRVVSSELDPSDDYVTTRVFVQSPFDQRVHENSRFWNASGIDVSVNATGVKIDTESFWSDLIGGIAFGTRPNQTQEVAADNSVPALREGGWAARRHWKGVMAAAFRRPRFAGSWWERPSSSGIQVGQVTSVTLG
jgi:paraquat-inducible protein B